MTCNEVRAYMFAYLDNELNVPLSMGLHRHLSACPGCSRDAEIEWAIMKHLRQALETPTPYRQQCRSVLLVKGISYELSTG